MDYQKRIAGFKYRVSLPPEDQCGLGCSPRRSHADTAVVLSPDDYDSLLRCRDAATGRIQSIERLYDLLCELRECIGNVSGSRTVNMQGDVDELDRLAAVANTAIGVLIDSAKKED